MKRYIMLAVRSSICNFRCRYCYLNQKPIWFKNKQIEYHYSPETVAKAFSEKRLGGKCLFNVCADGETLLAKDIEKYLFSILSQGHFVEFVTNMTITSTLNKILKFPKDFLERVEFKCSFHYLQLKEKNLLEVFAENVENARKKGCSICVEMIPHDELMPCVDEIKSFCLEKFGALPQLSIARNDNKRHDVLSKLSFVDYYKFWSQFDSEFFEFKKIIFKKKIRKYCCAGRGSLYVDLATGNTTQCYIDSGFSFNIFENVNEEIPFCSIGKCNDYYCYNGHSLLSVGLTHLYPNYHYGDLRNRKTNAGNEWFSKRMLEFMNEKVSIENDKNTLKKDKKTMRKVLWKRILKKIKK